MVRLKVGVQYQSNFLNSDISIPYGAIKSEVGQLIYAVAEEFQFLMVRLKESVQDSVLKLKNRFQFLMVRLKVQQVIMLL